MTGDQAPNANPPGDAVLTVRALECRRGNRVLFAPISFDVVAGSIVWIRGANGQGKTTLLRTLAGLSRPESGRIMGGELQSVRTLYLAHANALKEELSALESLRFLRQLDGGPTDSVELGAALARVGMASRRDAPVRTLSQGQRRRVALARLALPGSALVWLLDEPFDALDAGGVEILNDLLVEHAGRGGGVILTSHLALTISMPRPETVSLDALVPA